MKLSEFINKLQYLQSEQGDLDVMIDSLTSSEFEDADVEWHETFDIIEVY